MQEQDRWNIVYVILLTLGIASLLPWNMFITANDYFVGYKLNVTDESGKLPHYNKYFLSFIGVASKLPNVIFQGLNIFIPERYISANARLLVATLIEIVLFVETVFLAFVDSTRWPGVFFSITILTVILLNIFNGIFQSSLLGLASTLPSHFTNAVIAGMNTSGIISSLAMIISLAVSADPKISAVYYFCVAIGILLISLIFCIALPRIEYYKHHKDIREASEEEVQSIKGSNDSKDEKGFGKWIKETKPCWMQCFNVFLVFLVSLSVFPAVIANTEPKSNLINPVFFSPVFCFLSFNLFATIGNFLSTRIPSVKKEYLWIPIVLRILFIPLFLFCNYNPKDRKMAVLFNNDYVYIVGVALLALTTGYFSSLAMMYAPKCVKKDYSTTAGMLTSFSLIAGILAGINVSFIFPSLIK